MNANDPAFPAEWFDSDSGQTKMAYAKGMTKREYFAAMAMNGTLADGNLMATVDEKAREANIPTPIAISNFALQCADALIAELSK